ncbi:hypothetical protein Taro_019607 [Colocasia esculenta]|uniref:Uncharacterized protein n=1 Tax=Colocasia esculenta TaxID=4460 RepID=A0A843ULG9_COLES|nr:hypothetical protein [Colocasia esculenta]
MALRLVCCPNSTLEACSRDGNAFAYGHPFAQTGITFSSVIGITYKTPIRNRHSETLIAPLLLSNVSLDHVNPGRGNPTELAYHGNQKLCSTRCENSSPGH